MAISITVREYRPGLKKNLVIGGLPPITTIPFLVIEMSEDGAKLAQEDVVLSPIWSIPDCKDIEAGISYMKSRIAQAAEELLGLIGRGKKDPWASYPATYFQLQKWMLERQGYEPLVASTALAGLMDAYLSFLCRKARKGIINGLGSLGVNMSIFSPRPPSFEFLAPMLTIDNADTPATVTGMIREYGMRTAKFKTGGQQSPLAEARRIYDLLWNCNIPRFMIDNNRKLSFSRSIELVQELRALGIADKLISFEQPCDINGLPQNWYEAWVAGAGNVRLFLDESFTSAADIEALARSRGIIPQGSFMPGLVWKKEKSGIYGLALAAEKAAQCDFQLVFTGLTGTPRQLAMYSYLAGIFNNVFGLDGFCTGEFNAYQLMRWEKTVEDLMMFSGSPIFHPTSVRLPILTHTQGSQSVWPEVMELRPTEQIPWTDTITIE